MNIEFTEKDLLKRGVDEAIEEKSLKRKIKSGKKLRVKFGIDPTGPDIHIGHTVPLWKLKQFQELGHTVVLIIGDFTATIGDPSGQSKERKVITKEEVKKNMKKYVDQAGKILDIKKTEIRHNSEWHEKEGLEAALKLARTATYKQLTKRSDFKERIEKGGDLTLMELFYPLLQGYDSVKVNADIEIGGTDQKFNLLMGRQVQKRYGQEEQDIITLPLLVGTDGVKKMSKSYDNYVAVEEDPFEMFGKLMSITDKEILDYFELTTPLPLKEIEKMNKEKITGKRARDLKMKLASVITEIYWGENKAKEAKEKFKAQFQKQELPEDVEEIKIKEKDNIVNLLVEVEFASSKTEARRFIEQGAVYINDDRAHKDVKLPDTTFVLRVGRRKIVKINPK